MEKNDVRWVKGQMGAYGLWQDDRANHAGSLATALGLGAKLVHVVAELKRYAIRF